MKLLIYIFLISLSYVLSDTIDGNAKKKIVVKSYPKKVKPGMFQMNNAGKYIKYKTLASKRYKDDDGFTVYPHVHHEQLNIPDSPYFQVEKLPESKPRVKKVLPEYSWHTRSKRSVGPKKDDEKKKPNTNLRPALKPTSGVKANVTQKLNVKPKNLGKRLNKYKKQKRRPGLRKGKRQVRRPKNGRLRSGPNKNRKLKHGKSQNRNQNRANLRSKFGAQQAKKIVQDRRNFMNGTKVSQKVDTVNIHEKKMEMTTIYTEDIKLEVMSIKNTVKVDFSNAYYELDTSNVRIDLVGARRLISARDALIEEYPYVVSIQKEREHWCAGALLNQRLVITTANCLWKGNRISRMHVRAGSRHTDRGGQVANIQEVMKHPGWKIRKNPDNDVALMLLDKNIKFSHAVHGVDLPNRIMMPAFEDAWITSWGSERRDGVFESSKSNTLQVFHARVINRLKCNNVTQRFGVTVTENFICLAQTGRRAPCTRDTGAPAVSDGVLWGLASWGIRKLCGTERFPAVFSYLGSESNLAFITNATHRLMADERFYPFPDRVPRMS